MEVGCDVEVNLFVAVYSVGSHVVIDYVLPFLKLHEPNDVC